MAAISEGEVAVYDRQLRLWGVQAQQRLLKSKVLVWGLEGANIEVCKNLVLAGVSLVVRDHRSVTDADVSFNYFLRDEDLGQNRAQCAARRIQEMNPLCLVAASTAGVEDEAGFGDAALREALKPYDLVCLGLGVLGWGVERARSVDAACRSVQSGFILTLSTGEVSFFFSDLNEHVVQETASAQGAAASAPEQDASPQTVHFTSFGEWLECKPEALRQQKADASFLLVSLFLSFLRSDACKAGPGSSAQFEEYCQTVAKPAPAVDGIGDIKDAYDCFFVEPLIHVASIIGGLLTQEVIKAITKRDPPLVNSVCFNAHASVALVEQIPPAQNAPKKRKVEEVADLLD